ncbi:hypothetical protein CDEST_12551 [Colletotrichum destructivum]|uniref:Uncharacterized protein n=1 Tax=Colletotrichum destructivum TaxID=34406 RepID=A0AAX4IWD0_9PEZI|nr:hypothetical protein CDEST_12551 [Colletotrichum destructivum]
MDYEQLGRTNSGTECPFEGSVVAGLSWALEIHCIVSGIHNDAPTAQQPNLPPGPLKRMAEGRVDDGKFDLEVQNLSQCLRLYAHNRNDRSVHGFRDGRYPMCQMARGRTFERREARHATRACQACGQGQLPLLQLPFLVRAKAFGPSRRARRNLTTHGSVSSARNSRRQVKQESIVTDVVRSLPQPM